MVPKVPKNTKLLKKEIIDSIFDIFWSIIWFILVVSLFLTYSEWRENPRSEGPQIFFNLKLPRWFWKILQFVTSLKINSSSKFTIYLYGSAKHQVRKEYYLTRTRTHNNKVATYQWKIHHIFPPPSMYGMNEFLKLHIF